MNDDFDVLVIGLGPAGMAVAAMASEMGLTVCAVERRDVGGECMNVGCIPSKALLRMGKARAAFAKLEQMELAPAARPEVLRPFARIADHLAYISEKKTMGMFSKVEMLHRQGDAVFLDPRTVAVGERKITAKRIFICTGSSPDVPPVPGLAEAEPLTNETMFRLEKPPASLLVLGSGAIACEMAQAFARLGSAVTMVFRGSGLLWREDPEATALLEKQFAADGITLVKDAAMRRFVREGGETVLHLEDGRTLRAEKALAALGRRFDFSKLGLDRAGVEAGKKGIVVDKYLRTSQKHIYACGDCNGHHQFSHAAMHQGMLALMNCMLPPPFKRDFRKYPVPWTVFTEPQISRVGKSLRELDAGKARYQTVTARYDDYGAAIAESVATGFVKAAVSPFGKILGATIVGEGSGEMINEWTMAVQSRVGLPGILMQQHSFPTMGFLTKRVAETWMMGKMRSPTLRRLCRLFFRF
jgi:pyruvate/2-oxoglutarate dehydrogenase complex dihydrolipoamide dehydrogenase (E3) component